MAKLILSMDGLVLKEIPLNQERVTVGRKAHNDIQIDNLAVSGEHAAVVTILKDSFLEDLNSTNGTLVNGQSVKKHVLKDGDVIEFSKYKLKYFAELATDFEKEGRLEPGKINLPSSTGSVAAPLGQPRRGEPTPTEKLGLSQPALPAASEMADDGLPPAAIRLLNGASVGRQLELTRPLTSLGKHGVQVAVIARKPQGYVIEQSEGSPCPDVNGKAMESQERLLADHDVIELAGIKMEFFLKG